MTCFPIIPIWIIIIILGFLTFIILKNKKKNWHHLLIIILLFFINLRIMVPSYKSLTQENNLNIFFVIDNTISLTSEDYQNKPRLEAVKKDCKYIIEQFSGAKFSIITFDNTAKTITPLTNDINITKEAIDIINPMSEFYAKGTSLNTPLELLKTSLNQLEDKRKTILFFISDGEITDESTLKSYKELEPLLTNGAVLGYGTTSGGYMKNNNDYSYNKYIMNFENGKMEKAISKINETNLKMIAQDMNIDYIHMEQIENIMNKLTEIKKEMTTNLKANDKSSYEDTYYYLVIPLCLLLIIDLKRYGR